MKKIGSICLLALVFACETEKFTAIPTLSDFYTMRLTPEAASVAVGQTQQMTVTAYDAANCPTRESCNVLTPGNVLTVPGKPKFYVFKAADTLRVKVDSLTGVATATAAGTARIIAVLQDIPATASGQTSITKADTTIITVTAAPIAFGSIALTSNRATAAPNSTDTLTVTLKDNAGTTFNTQRANTITGTDVGRPQFYSNKPWIATVGSTGIITAVEPGTATITAVITIGGATKSATFDITVTSTPVTGQFTILQALSGSGTVFFPTTLTVSATQAKVEGRAGAVVTWTVASGTFTSTSTPNDVQCFNVTFANPAAAEASATGGNAGNIGTGAAGSANAPLCSGSQSRLFTTPGTYTFTSTTNGAAGTLIVN